MADDEKQIGGCEGADAAEKHENELVMRKVFGLCYDDLARSLEPIK